MLAAVALIVRRNLRRHALSTAVCAVSVALGAGLIISVWMLQDRARSAFTGIDCGFDGVAGSRGSALQLVLSSIFQIEDSPGNVPWSFFQELRADRRVTAAVPLAVGDQYRGYRLIGTTPEFLEFARGPGGQPLSVEDGGRWCEHLHDAVAGATAAQQLKLGPGSVFHPTHGLDEGGAAHEETCTVTGVLRPTGGPFDRAIYVPLESVFRMSGHLLRGAGGAFEAHGAAEIPDSVKEVSAILLRVRHPQAGFSLDEEFNRRGRSFTIAWPIGRVMGQLLARLGWVNQVLALVAYLTVVVAAAAILAATYNSMEQRRREIATLRALGARRREIFGFVLVEAAGIGALGALGSLPVSFAILAAARGIVREQTGVILDLSLGHPVFWIAPASMVVLAAVAGLPPALRAYRVSAGRALQDLD